MIGENLRRYRQDHKLTQKELANKLGIAEITVRQYEGNRRTPSIDDLIKFAHTLGVAPADLDDRLVISFNDTEVIAENGETYLIDPSCEVITKDGEVIPDWVFENKKKAGVMTDDDLLTYKDKSSPGYRADIAWKALNERGKLKAAEQIELVAEIPKYQK